MRVIIAGSRGITDYDLVAAVLDLSGLEVTTVLSGGARGVDELGERWAAEKGIPVERHPADWDRHGKAAGYIRNAEMADAAEGLILLWDGSSRGSKNMLVLALRRGLQVKAFLVEGDKVTPVDLSEKKDDGKAEGTP